MQADYEEDVSDEEDEVTGMHLEEPVDTKQINLIDLATSPDSSSKSLPFGADLSPLNPTPGSGFAAYMQQVPQASRGYAPSEQDEVDLDALEAYLAEDLAEAVPGADQEVRPFHSFHQTLESG